MSGADQSQFLSTLLSYPFFFNSPFGIETNLDLRKQMDQVGTKMNMMRKTGWQQTSSKKSKILVIRLFDDEDDDDCVMSRMWSVFL